MRPLVGIHLFGSTLTPIDELAPGEGHLGRPVWNPRQLLGDLELRLGLPRVRASAGLRVQQWSNSLAARIAASSARPYFAAAYEVDPTGTAAQLLRLRDELVDAGWDGEPLDGSERLETLAWLEACDEPPLPAGRADQLAAVDAELARATRSPYEALDLVDEVCLWPGRWSRVFQQLQRLGTRIDQVKLPRDLPSTTSDLARFQRALQGKTIDSTRPLAGDGSIVLLRGPTSSLLAEPVAALLAADPTPSTVVIRSVDPASLDAALERHGLGRQGVASSSRWRPALQILRLALAVAFVPKDPRRAFELLTLEAGPFAGRAGRVLVGALCERPGLGNALWLGAKQELSYEERARVEAWLELPRLDPAGACRHELLEVAERVLEWLETQASARFGPSWKAAAETAQAFIDALSGDGRERLDRPAVEQLLQDLAEETSVFEIAAEEAGRIDHVDGPERLLAPRDRVLWWGFAGEAPLSRSAFRKAELSVLRRAGLELPDPRALSSARFEAFVRAVLAARHQLVLVIPEQVAGKRCELHPLLDELVARVAGSERALEALTLSPEQLMRGDKLAAHLAKLPTESALLLELPQARRQWQVLPALIRPRETESASSLEKLIGCPLSWTLHYQAGLRSASRGGLAGAQLLAGKLGHRLLEELHSNGGLTADLDAVRRAAEEVVDRLVEQEGAGLLVSGVADERYQLCSELVDAAVAIAALLRDAELELVGVEVPVEGMLAGRPLRGSIDVLLRSKSGEERVLDLKYGSASYTDKLKAGHAIQLAVYAEARRQQSGAQQPPPAAYFSLKNKRLLATDAAPHFHSASLPGPSLSKTGEQIESTLFAISTTLEAGRIPVAGVKATEAGGLLKMLGVSTERAPEHLALSAEDACKYCSFGAVCGRSWEQPW